MITQIHDNNEFSALPEIGITAGKIRALYNAYGTSYDFCRFYRQGNSYISALDGSFVLCGDGAADISELADFFRMSGFVEIFCSSDIGQALAALMNAQCDVINSMRYVRSDIRCSFDTTTPLNDVYSIISEGFDIPFEPWYLDMSHRVRHGVSVCCTYENSAALVIQHDICGEALISQVACRKAYRGQGIAGRLVTSVAASLLPSAVYVLCEDELISFYEKCGFMSEEKYTVISRR